MNMYGYFSFTFHDKNATPVKKILCVFCATSQPDVDAVNVVIRRYCDLEVSPDRIVLLGMETEKGSLDEIARSPVLIERLPQHTRSSGAPAVVVEVIPREGCNSTKLVCGVRWDEVKCAGLSAIFRARRALLVAPATHHFRKPSTRHSDRFIRAANTLVDGAEIVFVAACCLRYVKKDTRHFYCDTGGISVLAFAIDSLRRRFDSNVVAATVNTFESYEGLTSFEFREPSESVVLISASTSSGLEQSVCRKDPRIKAEDIITMFGIGSIGQHSNVLLKLEDDQELLKSVTPWVSYPDGSCLLCKAGSIAVPMLSDQFIPVRSETRPALLLKEHSPGWLHRALVLFAGRSFLRAFFRSEHTFHATNDVFVDLEVIINKEDDSEICKRMRRIVTQAIPASAKLIVHLDDAASESWANSIKERFFAANRESVEVVSASKASEFAVKESGQKKGCGGACVVVAAVVASGQSLLAVSQCLRTILDDKAVCYLIGVARMPSPGHVEKLERDLRMAEMANDFSFSLCERIFLPLAGRSASCSWDEELEELKDWANTATGQFKTILEERIAVLHSAGNKDKRGIVEELFWCAADGSPLKLRSGYVFLPKEVDTSCVSQGDVYFSIAAVLHHLRSSDKHPLLQQTEYSRRVISPLNFDRFNDGIIQAAILRASLRPELDYSDSPEMSRQMSVVLNGIFGAADSGKGEACREFLLAMCLGRLVLVAEDLKELHDKYKESKDVVVAEMWKYMGNKINTGG